jgi:hypothetical protein
MPSFIILCLQVQTGKPAPGRSCDAELETALNEESILSRRAQRLLDDVCGVKLVVTTLNKTYSHGHISAYPLRFSVVRRFSV